MLLYISQFASPIVPPQRAALFTRHTDAPCSAPEAVVYVIADPFTGDHLAWPFDSLDLAMAGVEARKLDNWDIWRGRLINTNDIEGLFIAERCVASFDFNPRRA